METVFEILGIENKELQVSNLLAYYFNPERNIGYAIEFLNEFCNICGLNTVACDAQVKVETEKQIEDTLDGKIYKNRIDIFIEIVEVTGKKRVICIENKIYSEEGYRQTERYVKAIKTKCIGYDEYDFVYVTKNNSYVDLTSGEFKHIRYSEIAAVLEKTNFVNMPFVNDFCEYYVLREERCFADIEKNDKNFSNFIVAKKQSLNITDDDFNRLIDYVVWKVNNYRNNKNFSKIFCKNGKSAQSPDCFYQISHQEWETVINKKFINLTAHVDRGYTLHVEGKKNAVFLHFELYPYLPVSQIEKQYGKKFYEEYQEKQNVIKNLLNNIDVNRVVMKNIPGNASLTVGKWEINASSFKEYFDVLMNLINAILEKVKTL